jgi:hypothetical protein
MKKINLSEKNLKFVLLLIIPPPESRKGEMRACNASGSGENLFVLKSALYDALDAWVLSTAILNVRERTGRPTRSSARRLL